MKAEIYSNNELIKTFTSGSNTVSIGSSEKPMYLEIYQNKVFVHLVKSGKDGYSSKDRSNAKLTFKLNELQAFGKHTVIVSKDGASTEKLGFTESNPMRLSGTDESKSNNRPSIAEYSPKQPLRPDELQSKFNPNNVSTRQRTVTKSLLRTTYCDDPLYYIIISKDDIVIHKYLVAIPDNISIGKNSSDDIQLEDFPDESIIINQPQGIFAEARFSHETETSDSKISFRSKNAVQLCTLHSSDEVMHGAFIGPDDFIRAGAYQVRAVDKESMGYITQGKYIPKQIGANLYYPPIVVEPAVTNLPASPLVVEPTVSNPSPVSENRIKCGKCGSDQITANKKGWSLGKAVVGAAIVPFGLIGAAATGFIGSGKIKVTCLACGHDWTAGDQ